MKLLNQSIKYLAIALLFVVALWAIAFYFSMLNQIKDSIDEELEHQKRLIIRNTLSDAIIATKPDFDENLYTLERINKRAAISAKDQYLDTEILMQDADDPIPELEPVRMLVTVFRANNSYYQLKIVNPIIEQNDLIKALLWNVIGLYIILILSIIFINNFILKKLWQPFYTFLEQLKLYKIDDSKPLSETKTNIQEFKDLQQTVDEMTQRSVNAYNRQKEFTENAAHELQTPIAIARNKIELLFEENNLTENQVQKLTETYQVLQRLTKLNKSLLLLSKIENIQIMEELEINFNELVKQNIKELEEIALFKKVEIVVAEKDSLVRKMDKSYAQILVANLLKNAIYHNIENGKIEILIDTQQLSISNTGNEEKLDNDKIFNRFQKYNSFSNSTGLGLAIVKAIASIYRLEINYYFQDKKHCFQLKFGKQ
ncbi:signal transduction histidine kinase [Balneicella halophila]|uniref:histidine kinase n=1 Tax=Balneicella halophila TaxID=1537566 RepID=A0A7L4UN78_BALHA|nr:HAMP domain-containing sensor histidine kinase [Balneicella halophila]PVX49297.1 signal transduction histidine kinase [Balneicella halophila]